VHISFRVFVNLAMETNDEDREAAPIRKRRYSTARIQPTRIKKVMQSDEEIGRMIASVPVAIGSTMEHFAENLLRSAAQCVQLSSARTLTPSHIRYAILKNSHFSFLETLTKDIPTPRGEESEQSSTSKTPMTGFSPTSDQIHAPNFSSIYQQSNFPTFPQQVISSYDLNANTSHQRPTQFSKEQETSLNMPALSINQSASSTSFSVPKVPPKIPTQAPLEQGKRKRGRPRKEPKEKFVEVVNDATSSTNGDGPMPTTPEELDRIRMPPPSFGARRSVPARELVNNENSDCTTSNRTPSTKTSLTAI